MNTDQPPPEQCPFCISPHNRYWFAHASRADGAHYPIFRCQQCGSSFVFPSPTDEYLTDFYQSDKNSHGGGLSGDTEADFAHLMAAEARYPNSSVDADRIAANAWRHAHGKKFLDIGSGYGFFTSAARKIGFECQAIEAGKACCDIFERMNGFRPHQGMMNDAFVACHRGQFDVVLLSQVLEHIPKPLKLVRQLHDLLKPDGLCVVAVPHFGSTISALQGKRDMFICPPEHLNFFSSHGLTSLLRRGHFDCIEMHTVSRFDRNKLAERLKSSAATAAVNWGLGQLLRASDSLGKGMFLNAYFRRVG